MPAVTTIHVEGSVNTWIGSTDAWFKHNVVIDRWVEGAQIQLNMGANWILCEPSFGLEDVYRLTPKVPSPGEVWDIEGTHYISIAKDKFASMSGCTTVIRSNCAMFIASSIDAYYNS